MQYDYCLFQKHLLAVYDVYSTLGSRQLLPVQVIDRVTGIRLRLLGDVLDARCAYEILK